MVVLGPRCWEGLLKVENTLEVSVSVELEKVARVGIDTEVKRDGVTLCWIAGLAKRTLDPAAKAAALNDVE